MSSSDQRTTIVAMMWFATALIGIAIADAGSIWAVFGLFAIALAATVVLMREPGSGALFREKQKRGSADHLSLLLEMLDEDERAAFKETLKQRMLEQIGAPDEGELPADADTLAALLDADDHERAASN
jgi:hypothetical protein